MNLLTQYLKPYIGHFPWRQHQILRVIDGLAIALDFGVYIDSVIPTKQVSAIFAWGGRWWSAPSSQLSPISSPIGWPLVLLAIPPVVFAMIYLKKFPICRFRKSEEVGILPWCLA